MASKDARHDREGLQRIQKGEKMNIDEIKIPSETTQTIYVVICLNPSSDWYFGEIKTTEMPYHEWSKSDPDNYGGWKLLAQQDVTIQIPHTEIDVHGEMLQALDEEKRGIIARHCKELHDIEAKISKLQAIEYKPSEGLK